MKPTNKQVIEANIQMFQVPVDRWERRQQLRKLTAKEAKAYKRDLRRLEKEKAKLRSLEMMGEDMYTKVYPSR